MKAEASSNKDHKSQDLGPITIPEALRQEFRREMTTTRAPLSREDLIRLQIAKAKTGKPIGVLIREAVQEKLARIFL